MPSDTRAVVRLISERLVERGYSRSKPNVFTRPTPTSGIVSWVGLNLAKRRGVVEVNPMVGVRHGPVEALVAELCEATDDHVVPPTAALNVGYLTPHGRYECFLFDGVRTDEIVAHALVDKVDGVATTFASENERLEGLVQTLKTKPLMPEQTAYRLPVALLLMGKSEDARIAVDLKLREIGARSDPAAVRFRTFAERLRAHGAPTG